MNDPKKAKVKILLEYLLVAGVAAGTALCNELFIFPNSFAPAGINGIATMVQYKMNFSVGYMNLLLNLPLCLISLKILNRDYAAKSLLFCLTFSLTTLVFKYRVIDVSPYLYHTDSGTSIVLAPLAAGVINGFLFALAYRVNASVGGTSIIGALEHHRRPERNMVYVTFVLNTVVAVVSYFVYHHQMEPVICCILYCFVSTIVSDRVLHGGRAQSKFEIICDDPEKIAREIIEKTHHSATVLPAKGMYQGKETSLLICLIHPRQIPQLKRILARHKGVFAYVSGVSEIYGNYKTVKDESK